MSDNNSDESVSETEPNAVDILFDFELPPVTETSENYVDSDPVESLQDNGLPGDSGPGHGEAEVDPETEAEKIRGTPDDRGGPYDPSIHAYPPAKTPTTGRWKKKRKPRGNTVDEPLKAETTNASVAADAHKAAILYAAIHKIAYGVDGTPEHPEYDQLLQAGFENYFLARGSIKAPPEIDLLLTCGMYTQDVVMKEVNAKKTKRFFSRMLSKSKRLLGFGGDDSA